MFKDITQRDKSSTGWFYGCRLHISINKLMAVVKYSVSVLLLGIKMTESLKLCDILQKIFLENLLQIRDIFLKN
ncbi:MAG: hypothetical protein HFH66_12275 [Lachnospiraceae bacterium]|uniref:transposase n=1 Tax=uncultured Clostridium sp. TaxID=59620 RepID=UPI00351D6B9C|nr:hypothetical protein [Lachnospiraceae bacterium]